MKEDINALDEIHKGACMGVDAINFVIDKVKDKKFKEELEKELNNYEQTKKEVEEIYPDYNEGKPHETSAMNKAMTWYGIQMRTMMDDTTSKLSELLMQGTNMGIIEGRRLINQNPHASDDVKGVLHDFVTMQEDSVETLKKYL